MPTDCRFLFSRTQSGLDTALAVLYSGIIVTLATTSEKNTLTENACCVAALCGVKQIIFDCFLVRSRACVCV